MKDPLQRGTSSPPPVLGEGCVRRYDVSELDDSYGTEFPEAERLWQRLQDAPESDEPDDPAV
ncbi:hypothetical protein [Pseudomonas mangiferae]|uniref:Uncharacterized protein n=1 Tax=Pseudomonas mangiferae TaxID=2593654 RepID=A0A553H101_9PSED|nr:hypothetical protein [Pseudomonas mangiferae]TRX75420.1 hypothetical protein FM069_06690 [Pseudomonas mangiferae]